MRLESWQHKRGEFMANITPIKAFDDNYIWMLKVTDQGVILVDPGDAAPVIAVLESESLDIAAILLTHHHGDHSGGITALRDWSAARGQAFKVYGSAGARHVDHPCHQSDSFSIQGTHFEVLEVPGHTLDHIAFITGKALFCGDTLFSGGCGRLFEGTAAQMYESLSKIKELPADTQVYCAHEYTLSNLKFARVVEPNNEALKAYETEVIALRARNEASVPSLLATELAINPFLRVNQGSLVRALANHWQQQIAEPVTAFALLRRWKDNF